MSSPRTTNILLVEDDEVEVESLRRALKKAGITDSLWVAHSGREALEMLRGSALPAHRRVVLLDLNMPGKSGLETLREIRQDPSLSGLSVVMLSGELNPRDQAEAYRLHAAGYLVKPMTFEAMVEMVSTLHDYWSHAEFP